MNKNSNKAKGWPRGTARGTAGHTEYMRGDVRPRLRTKDPQRAAGRAGRAAAPKGPLALAARNALEQFQRAVECARALSCVCACA